MSDRKSTKTQCRSAINELRLKAEVEGAGSLSALLLKAADLIEALEERVDILSTEIEAYEQENVPGNSAPAKGQV